MTKNLEVKIRETKELRPDFFSALLKSCTACAGAMMNESEVRRKVRCHSGAVEETQWSADIG
jgi:hypothetical protein